MKNQALFSSKDQSKKIKCRLLQFLFAALRASVARHWADLPAKLLVPVPMLVLILTPERSFNYATCTF